MFCQAQEDETVIAGYIRELKRQPTAWFCVNDGLGFFVSTSLQRYGLNVPDDVSVCSFDNGQLSQIATPKITTVDIDLKRYDKRAVELLRWRWDNPNEPFQEVLLSTKLIKRESTAAKPTR